MNTSTPSISIIIPVYNAQKYLKNCLNDLIDQTFRDIEIICIDDGSSDTSLNILNEYARKDNRIKVFNQPNSGPATARNVGLDHATGQYVMFCDSDDWYEKNTCQIMLNTIQNTKADMVMCNTLFEYESEQSKQVALSQHRIDESKYNHTCDELLKMNSKLRFQTNVLLWNKIWKMDIIRQNGIRFPDGCEHDDDAFWYMYSFFTKNIYQLNQFLYHYVVRQNSIMDNYCSGKPKNKKDRMLISNAVFDFLKKNNLLKHYENDMIAIYQIQLFSALKFFDKNEKFELIKPVNAKIQKEWNPCMRIFLLKSGGVLFLKNKHAQIRMLFRFCVYKLISLFIRNYKKRKLEEMSDCLTQLFKHNPQIF